MRAVYKSMLLGLMVTWPLPAARAEGPRWRPVRPPSEFATLAQPADLARLGRPVPLADAEPAPAAPVQPASHAADGGEPVRRFIRAQNADFPLGPGPGQIPPPPPPPPPPPTGGGPAQGPGEAYYCGQPTTSKSGPFERTGEFIDNFGRNVAGGPERGLFQSDHCFDQFISPVTVPFLAEDPRALTEVRPVFIYQSASDSAEFFRGGNLGFFGLQGRVAFTERFSLVINKLGWTWINPRDDFGEFRNGSGFSELWLGPKFTIIRNEECGTLLAAGLTFQIPVGSSRVFQDTGDLTLAPYVSFGQNFLKSNAGSFNFLNTTGYAFSTDNERTDYFYSTFHLSYDIANLRRYYPLIELNWVHYTQNGGARFLSYEGKDLINFGSRGIAGHSDLSIAVGGRIKLSECIQFGAAAEFPLITSRDLNDFRVTADVIFRY
jgi:hypothetical protein